MSFVSRGFRGRRRDADVDPARVPPGQSVTRDFPVLSAGATPHTPLDRWTVSIENGGVLRTWTWEEFRALPSEPVTADIHCLTRWSKLDTTWEGVSVDTLLDEVDHDAGYVLALCDGGYTTNLPLEDVTGGMAWVVYSYEGEPRAYPTLIHFNRLDKGAHFAAWEQPQLFSEEVRAGFRPLRK